MVNNPVEAVAQAMAKSDFEDDGEAWIFMIDSQRDRYRAAARAAVKALREPTPYMASRGFIADECTDPMSIFRAMIDAALVESTHD